MKIVIYSSTFLPNIGGVEIVMSGLAEEWANLGHEVTLFTLTSQHGNYNDYAYRIVEKPSFCQLNQAVVRADIYVEANISFKNSIVGLLNKKKWFLIHHTQYDHQNKVIGFLKNKLSCIANNIAVSKFIADKIGNHPEIIENFYSPVFRDYHYPRRSYDFVFLGRLVSDKGVVQLLYALFSFKWEGKCIIIGDGEERTRLEAIVADQGFSHQVIFLGNKSQEESVELLNQSKVLVIPSLWDEPFGVVALEGMACGCTIACSNKNGLIEATGNLAFYFDSNKIASIAETLQEALQFNPTDTFIEKSILHLRKHQRREIAEKYIRLFENSSF